MEKAPSLNGNGKSTLNGHDVSLNGNSNSSVNPKRYSDEELEEFRIIIERKIQKTKENINHLSSSILSGEHIDTSHERRDAPGNSIMETNSKVVDKDSHLLDCLNNALKRIENKTYGICAVTGELIPKERLRAVPHATLSIEAKLERQKTCH